MGADERTANDITRVEIMTVTWMFGNCNMKKFEIQKTCISSLTGPHNEISQSDTDKNINCFNAQESDFISSYH